MHEEFLDIESLDNSGRNCVRCSYVDNKLIISKVILINIEIFTHEMTQLIVKAPVVEVHVPFQRPDGPKCKCKCAGTLFLSQKMQRTRSFAQLLHSDHAVYQKDQRNSTGTKAAHKMMVNLAPGRCHLYSYFLEFEFPWLSFHLSRLSAIFNPLILPKECFLL